MSKNLFLIFFFVLGLILFNSCNDNSFVPDNPEDSHSLIPEKNDNYNTANYIIWAGKNYNIGNLTIKNDDNILTITYKTSPGYFLTETSFHIADSWQEIPQNNGVVQPDKFNYKSIEINDTNFIEYQVLLNDIDKNDDNEIFIAAHCIVKSESNDSIYIFPSSVNMNYYGPENFGYPSSFNIKINSPQNVVGFFDGWCLGYNVEFNENNYDAKTFYSYTDGILNTQLNHYKNLDLINWVINQHFVGKFSLCNEVFNVRDVQIAIWYLLNQFNDSDWENERLSYWDGYASECRVKEIVEMAFNEGRGYIPVCGEYMGIVLEPTNGYQPVLIENKIPCGFFGEQTCWAGYENKDFTFSNYDSSKYIKFQIK